MRDASGGARTRVAFLDVSAGVAGDMCLGALVDAGLPLSALEEVVERLGLDGTRVRARRVTKGALAATKVDVLLPGALEPPSRAHPRPTPDDSHPARETHDSAHEHGHEHAHEHGHGHADRPPHDHGHEHEAASGHPHAHRGLADVLKVVRGAKGLPSEGIADAVRAFTVLAEAEGRVHGISPDEVRFHEVGAVDALVDVVGTCVGLAWLGVREVRTSALPWFTGRARMAHGELPLPAPAVVELLAGHPTYPSGETFEQVTPTGAALVRALSRGQGPPVGFVPRRTGVGAGDHPGGRLPNVVRLVLGDVEAEATPTDAVLLETNLDDATGQEVGRAIERALATGALDAWATPCTMKKGRPGVVLAVLCEASVASVLEDVLLRETPTLGIRRRTVARRVVPRRFDVVSTAYGSVRVKVRETPAGDEATPEYEECRACAERTGTSWRAVAAAALAAWRHDAPDVRESRGAHGRSAEDRHARG